MLGSLTLKQSRAGSFNTEQRIEPAYASGQVRPAEYHLLEAGPSASFTTTDLATLLAVSGIMDTGVAVNSGTLSIPIQYRAPGSTFASGSNHATISAANGHYLCENVSWSQGQNAEARVMAWFRSTDGYTDPITIAGSAAVSGSSFVSAFVGSTVSLSYAGPTTTTDFELTDATINCGVTVTPYRHSGGPFPQEFNITQQTPYMDLTFKNFGNAVALGQLLELTAAVVKFRKRDKTSWVADGTASHASFTFADAVSSIEVVNFTEGSQDGTVQIKVYGETLTLATDATFS